MKKEKKTHFAGFLPNTNTGSREDWRGESLDWDLIVLRRDCQTQVTQLLAASNS